MGTREVLELFGGFALFLYGRQMMCNGLETAMGNRMKDVLKKLTANPFFGVVIGILITVVIQSSSATVWMAAGFVGSGMITLQQAVWVVMGANIGTTITGQLIALGIDVAAPMFVFVGVILLMIWKKHRYVCAGEILAGMGVFFMGLDMMEKAMLPLQEYPGFTSAVGGNFHPVLGMLAGIFFTMLLQSSAISVGILQALAASGLIGMKEAAFVVFGQNIGTCLIVVLASAKTVREGKRVTWIHLCFNLVGMVLFTVLCITTPLVPLLEQLTPLNPAAQVANMHTIFNLATALLLLPADKILVRVSDRLLPGQEQERREKQMPEKHLQYLISKGQFSAGAIGSSAIYFTQLRQEILRMLEMAQENVDKAFWAFRMSDEEAFSEIDEREQYIDYLNQEISRSISRRIVHESNERDTMMASQYFQMTLDVKRIGDHAMKIAEYLHILEGKKISFSREAHREMEQIEQVLQVTFETLGKEDRGSAKWLMRVGRLEQDIDNMTIAFRKAHMERIKKGICSEEACSLYSEMLADFERVGDHALNIAQGMLEMDMIA
ncbi:MAG: Na/Pi cotransporter family protein [Lachnospiraceae bacterium]|nr:Na/Pi cotransporter family protein [Lachnospiraceae bacterium]